MNLPPNCLANMGAAHRPKTRRKYRSRNKPRSPTCGLMAPFSCLSNSRCMDIISSWTSLVPLSHTRAFSAPTRSPFTRNNWRGVSGQSGSKRHVSPTGMVCIASKSDQCDSVPRTMGKPRMLAVSMPNTSMIIGVVPNAPRSLAGVISDMYLEINE